MMEQKIPLVVVAGPTASGKTAAGVRLAQLLDGEVISADSMQIYKYLTVGTAKPIPEEMEGIPHHLIDFLEPSETFSVADYVQLAKQKIEEITGRGKLPILVGGTGLYISSLIDNIEFSQSDSDTKLREEYQQFAKENGPQALWDRLNQVDPQAAEKIHPNNVGRVARALEVYHTTGIPISKHQELSRTKPSPYQLCMMALGFHDRQKLYDRINLRVDQMVQDGLLEEVQSLKERGYTKDMVSMQGLGYKEILDYLDGDCTLEETIYILKRDTRHFAKRQLTWFRRERDVIWIDKSQYDHNEAKVVDMMITKIQERIPYICLK